MRNRQLVQPPAFVFAKRRLQVHCDDELARRLCERQSRSARRGARELLHRPRDPFPCVQLSDAQSEPSADPDSKPKPDAESEPEPQSQPHPTPKSKLRSAPKPDAEPARQSDSQPQPHPNPNLHLVALAFASPNAIPSAGAALLPAALADTIAARIAVQIAARIAVPVAAAVAVQIEIEIAIASPQSHRAGLRADSSAPSDAHDESGLPRHGLFHAKEGHHRGQLASLKDARREEELVRVRCRQ